jgi:RNA polymerase sigma factor (sigma-70 family)
MNEVQFMDWIDQHQKADETQFYSLIDQHQPMIGKICGLYKESKEDRGDLFREIVFQLWRSAATGNDKQKPSTWIYQVALSTAISGNILHASKRFGNKIKQPAGTDIKQQLLYAIRQLTDDDKAIFLLYLEELPYAEIAEITGIAETIVGVKLNRIKKKVQQLITVPREQYILKSIWRNIEPAHNNEAELKSMINEPASPVFGILNNILTPPSAKTAATNSDLKRSLEDQLGKIRSYARASVTSRVIVVAFLLLFAKFVIANNMTLRWIMVATLLLLIIHVVVLSITWMKRARQLKFTINHLRSQREFGKRV